MEINGKVHCFFEQEEWRDINGFEGLYQVSNKKYCYEFTEHRQYKCCECGRTMHEPVPHYCNGQYRKHHLKFKEYGTEQKSNYPC